MTEGTTLKERMFPIQHDGGPPHPTSIPWSVADKAYSVYAGRYGSGQSLERLAERGGFGALEMDKLHPKWREETSEIADLRAQLQTLRGENERLKANLYDLERRGEYTEEVTREKTLAWAAKHYGCDKIGPDCPSQCIARCESIDNLRVTIADTKAQRDALAQEKAALEATMNEMFTVDLVDQRVAVETERLRGVVAELEARRVSAECPACVAWSEQVTALKALLFRTMDESEGRAGEIGP